MASLESSHKLHSLYSHTILCMHVVHIQHCPHVCKTYIFTDTIISYGSGRVEDNVVCTRTQKIKVKI